MARAFLDDLWTYDLYWGEVILHKWAFWWCGVPANCGPYCILIQSDPSSASATLHTTRSFCLCLACSELCEPSGSLVKVRHPAPGVFLSILHLYDISGSYLITNVSYDWYVDDAQLLLMYFVDKWWQCHSRADSSCWLSMNPRVDGLMSSPSPFPGRIVIKKTNK